MKKIITKKQMKEFFMDEMTHCPVYPYSPMWILVNKNYESINELKLSKYMQMEYDELQLQFMPILRKRSEGIFANRLMSDTRKMMNEIWGSVE